MRMTKRVRESPVEFIDVRTERDETVHVQLMRSQYNTAANVTVYISVNGETVFRLQAEGVVILEDERVA